VEAETWGDAGELGVGPQPRLAFALPVGCYKKLIRLRATSGMLDESDSLLPLIRWMGESDSCYYTVGRMGESDSSSSMLGTIA